MDETATHTKPPIVGTTAAFEYWWASYCDFQLFHLTTTMALNADYVSHIAAHALDGKSAEERAKSPVDLAGKTPGKLTQALRRQSQELLEMFISRAVDNFQVYIVEVIRETLNKQPRILFERKQELTLGHILKFDSIDALVRDIVEAKISSLSYEGFGDVEGWCASKGIPLVIPDGMRPNLVELVALRNIIVHSRAVVDERFKATVPHSSFKVGERRRLNVDEFLQASELLNRVVSITDNAVAGKFGLTQVNVWGEIGARRRAQLGAAS